MSTHNSKDGAVVSGNMQATYAGRAIHSKKAAPLSFSLWCDSNQLVLPRTAKSQECTHYTMDGFKMNIPWAMYDSFLQKYSEAVFKDNHDLFFIEKKENLDLPNPSVDSVYKMHFDVDFVQPEAVTLDFVCDMTATFLNTIKTFYPDKPTLLGILCQAPPKHCKGADQATPCIKTGFHLIVDNLFVKRVEALTLREACVAAYIQKYGERSMPSNSIQDAIDSCVYNGNGLRMPGSKKMVKCTACTKSKDPCFVCKGPRRMVKEDRAYMPTHTISDSGAVEPVVINEDYASIMKLCSIRSPLTECDVMVRPPGAPVSALAQPQPKSIQKVGDKRNLRYEGGVFKSDVVGLNKYPHGIESSTEVFQEIQAYVRKFNRVYANIEICSIRSNEERTRYVCRTRGWGSSYCLNVARDHTNNTIYFELDSKKGLSQRCFSNKDCPTGCTKKCRSFASTSVPLPEMLRAALFPKSPKLASASMSSGSRASSVSDMTERAAAIHVAKMIASSSAAAAAAAEPPLSVQALDSLNAAPDLSKMSIKQVDSMSMLDLAKAQKAYDSMAELKAKRMRDEMTSKVAMPSAKRNKTETATNP
jgi:hypothetical protein